MIIRSFDDLYDLIKNKKNVMESIRETSENLCDNMLEIDSYEYDAVFDDEDLHEFLLYNIGCIIDICEAQYDILSCGSKSIKLFKKDIPNRFDPNYPNETLYYFNKCEII